MNIQFCILREEFPTKLIAIVEARLTDTVRDEKQLREAITKAVTAWMRDTVEGEREFGYSGSDFNIGDLGNHVASELEDGGFASGLSLLPFLSSHGVFDLSITICGPAEDWNYDTPLTRQEEKNL